MAKIQMWCTVTYGVGAGRGKNRTITPTLCNRTMVASRGPVDAKVMVVLDSPMPDEYQYGILNNDVGVAMREEFIRANLDPSKCRIVYLWPHLPAPDDTEGEHMEQNVAGVLHEAEHPSRRAILIVGAEASTVLLGVSSQDVAGVNLAKTHYARLFRHDLVMATTSMRALATQPVGEFRLALEKFTKQLEAQHGT